MENLLLIVLFLMAIFLILLVLVQRGRGGGLAGAFGGAGGSSAFGAKAGDTFTRITIWAASIWIVTCIGASYWASHRDDPLGRSTSNSASSTVDLFENGMGTPKADDDASTPDASTPDAEAPATDAETSGGAADAEGSDQDTPADGE